MSVSRSFTPTPEPHETILDHAPVMVWRSGPNPSCDYFSAAWLRFTGRTSEEALGEGWLESVHPDDREKRLGMHRRHAANGTPYEVEYRLRRHDGEYRRVLDRASPYREEGMFRGFVGACLDLEDRVDAEHARDGFLRNIAHELRTPLQAVRMLVEIVCRSAAAGEAPDPAVGRRIDAQFDRLGEMIDTITEAGRPESAELHAEPLDLALLLRRLAEGRSDALRVPGARTRHVLRYRGPDHARVVGDRRRLKQAFGNLIDNAVKFSPRGGVVELRLKLEPEAACVEVHDQGIGIPAAEIPLVARRFYRGSNAPRENFPGPGLGLAIARDVLESHGGSLEIESQLDQGTRVTARLPAREGRGPG
jgi:two-component system, OmpR family, sensor histidine kinase VicK